MINEVARISHRFAKRGLVVASLCRLLPLCWLLGSAIVADASPGPLARPAELEPAVTFWRRVYTEITTNEGFIHDDERLDVVYETVRLSSSSDRARGESASDAASRYVRALRAIAAGKRDDLNAAERRVMELWGPNIDRQALTEAAERVRFQLGQADKFRAGLIRSGRWESYIKKTMTDAGLPIEIASLPHVESSFNPEARSKVGAAGMWQFMVSTGRRYLRIDNVVDERLDPYKSTDAAALLMRQNYEVTGAWPLAITAYNHGAAGMRRAIAQVGTDDIATVVRRYRSKSFGFASRNFYVCLLAAVEVDGDPTRFFGVIDRDAPEKSRVWVVPGYVAAGALAKSLGVGRDQLEALNPGLRDVVWNGSKRIPKGYEMRVPSSVREPGEVLASLPQDAWNSKQVPDLFHIVQRGETLSSIAPRYGARVKDLIAINSLSRSASIRPGQKLMLPAGIAKNAPGPASGQGVYPGAPAAPVVTTKRAAKSVDAAAPTEVVEVASAAPTVAAATSIESPSAAASAAKPSPASTAAPTGPAPAPAPAAPGPVPVPSVAQIGPPPGPAPASAAPDVAGASAAPLEAERVQEEVAEIEQQQLLADPSDYSVAADRTIRIQEDETMGHYADWARVRAGDLRRINRIRGTPVLRVGHRLKIDLSNVTAEQFESARIAYHRELQEQFFASHRIVATNEHVVKAGESIWLLAERQFNVPVWLLRQYNPDLDLANVKPSTRVVIPVLAGPGA